MRADILTFLLLGTCRVATLLLVVIAACTSASAQPVIFSNPDQFLVDKETDFVAIVTVTRVENRWVVLPDGDHVPFVIADSTMEEVLSGPAWPVGRTESTMQFDYNDLMFDPIAPPAIPDRRYILWASRSHTDAEIPFIAPWIAHPQGVLLIRRQGNQEFVFWNGKSYSLAVLRQRLRNNPPLPLDQIVDPARRLKVAEARLESGALGDDKAFIRGLLLNVLDPVDRQRDRARIAGRFPRESFRDERRGHRPTRAPVSSLALLRDFGKQDGRREATVAALTPIATTARRRIRLTAALALVDLGSAAGREALIAGFNVESGAISSDPADDMTFPGRYPYDDSSITACAHALARLGIGAV